MMTRILSVTTALLVTIGMMQGATALTLKSGQVLGGDGEIYDGASPQQQEQLVKNAQ